MECNKLIKTILTTNVTCTEEVFGKFCLFANGILPFDEVLRTAEKDNINFIELCNKCDVDFSLICQRK